MHSQSELLCTVLYIVAVVSQSHGGEPPSRQGSGAAGKSPLESERRCSPRRDDANANSTKETFHRGGVCDHLLLRRVTVRPARPTHPIVLASLISPPSDL